MKLGPEPEMTYEEIVGTPQEVLKDAVWPDNPEPVKRLRALCLDGWHSRLVGPFFRWSDEEVRLDDETVVTYNTWAQAKNEFSRTWTLHCDVCGKPTRHAAKGFEYV